MPRILAIFVLFLLAFCANSGCQAFLREKPSYLETCRRSDVSAEATMSISARDAVEATTSAPATTPSFGECMRNAFQHIFTSWRNIVPGAEEQTKPIDPLFVPRLEVNDEVRANRRIPQLNVQSQNLTASGLREANVTDVTLQANGYSFRMIFAVPRVILRGRYMAKGQVNLMRLDSAGDLFMEIVKGVYTVIAKVELREQEKDSLKANDQNDTEETPEDSKEPTNFHFFHIKALKFTVNSLENVRVNFTNLFPDEGLTKNINALLNDRWRLLFAAFKPRVERAVGEVFLEHFRALFSAIPAEFFIEDLETGET